MCREAANSSTQQGLTRTRRWQRRRTTFVGMSLQPRSATLQCCILECCILAFPQLFADGTGIVGQRLQKHKHVPCPSWPLNSRVITAGTSSDPHLVAAGQKKVGQRGQGYQHRWASIGNGCQDCVGKISWDIGVLIGTW